MAVCVSGSEDYSKEPIQSHRFSTIFGVRRQSVEKELWQTKKAVSGVGGGPVIDRTKARHKSSQLRFIIWVGSDRLVSKLTEEQQRTCPLLDCGTIVPDKKDMVKHVAECPCLSKGLYKCFECDKEERIGMYHVNNNCKEPQCLDPLATFANSLRQVKRKLSRRGSQTGPSGGSSKNQKVAHDSIHQWIDKSPTDPLQQEPPRTDPVEISSRPLYELGIQGHDYNLHEMGNYCVKKDCQHLGPECSHTSIPYFDRKEMYPTPVLGNWSDPYYTPQLSADTSYISQHTFDSQFSSINPVELSADTAPVELSDTGYILRSTSLEMQVPQSHENPWNQPYRRQENIPLETGPKQNDDDLVACGFGVNSERQSLQTMHQLGSVPTSKVKPTLHNIRPPTTPQYNTPIFTKITTLSPAETNISPASSIESSIFSAVSGHSSQNTCLSSFDSYSPVKNYSNAKGLLFQGASHGVSTNSEIYVNALGNTSTGDSAWSAQTSPSILQTAERSGFEDIYTQHLMSPQLLPSLVTASTPYRKPPYIGMSSELTTPSRYILPHSEPPYATPSFIPPITESTKDTVAKYQCSCGHEPGGKEANKTSNLKRHLNSAKVHSPHNKPHKCYHPDCGRRFTRSDNLLQHQRRKNHSAKIELKMPSTSLGWI